MPQTFKREPLTTAEAERMNQSCDSLTEKLVVWTLLDTGLRVHELCNLTPMNVDWQAHHLIIVGKGRKRRIVPMTDRVKTLLETYFTHQKDIGFGVRTAQLIVKRVANRASVSRPCSPHVLRHTFAINCTKKAITLSTIQRLLGHSSLTTTFIYQNMLPEDALEEFRRKF